MDFVQLTLYTKSTAIPIYQFNQDFEPLFSTLDNIISLKQLFHLPIYKSLFKKKAIPAIQYINDIEIYGHFYFDGHYYVVGPILHHPILTLKDRHRLSFYASLNQSEWQKRTHQIPIMSIEAFETHLSFIYYLITQTECPQITLPQKNNATALLPSDYVKSNIDLGLAQIQEVIEKRNIDEVEAITLRTWHGYHRLLSLDNFLQSMYLYVSVLTHCTVYAFQAGANLHEAMELKDRYILKADSEHDRRFLLQHFQNFMYELIDLVPKPEYSSEIRQCIDYIQRHLDETLDTDKLSLICHLSRSYLCIRFKKEVGMTIAQFVLETRINKAKKELSQTTDSILTIQERNGFKSQSHFTTQFKKQTKMTPKAWRQKFH